VSDQRRPFPDEAGNRVQAGAGGKRGRAAPMVAVLLLAAACGWLVMELEILGTRMLAPYFGSSIYVVMGSVIGVFLLSLSGGYVLGGWLSRREAAKRALGMCLIIAGGWLCAVPGLLRPVCDALLDAGLDEKWGSLLAAFALFGLPTLMLGMVSPTAVRWLTQRAAESGLKAGLVLGCSTVASFAGCVVTAFYLILLSARRTVRVSGSVLIAVGAIVLVQAVLAGRAPSVGGRP